jgi:hypothetical protein
LSRGNRSNVGKAIRSGLIVEPASSDGDYEDYYAAYEDSLRRWGPATTSHYPIELFQAVRLYAPDAAKLWLVKREGQVLGGALNFYHNRRVIYWHGAFLERAFELRPANLVHVEAMKHACDAGFEWYDLGPSGGHEGVVSFKRTFHPQELQVERGRIMSPAYRRFLSMRRMPARRRDGRR